MKFACLQDVKLKLSDIKQYSNDYIGKIIHGSFFSVVIWAMMTLGDVREDYWNCSLVYCVLHCWAQWRAQLHTREQFLQLTVGLGLGSFFMYSLLFFSVLKKAILFLHCLLCHLWFNCFSTKPIDWLITSPE